MPFFLLDISWHSPRFASFCLFVCFIFVLICVIEWLVLISHCSHTHTPSVPVPAPLPAFVLCNHKCCVAHAAYAQCARLQLIELSSAWPSDQVTNCLDFNFSSSFSRAQHGESEREREGVGTVGSTSKANQFTQVAFDKCDAVAGRN